MSVHVVRPPRETPSARRRLLQREALAYIRRCDDTGELRRELRRGGLAPVIVDALRSRLQALTTA